MIAIFFLLVVTVGPYMAFTKHIPFTSYGYEVKATFANGVNISKNSPVRIAGVEVGKVINVERDGDATKVAFTVEEAGRPIHEDAFAEIRPRIFLEGNFFIELDPGSPSSRRDGQRRHDPGQPHLDRGPARRDPDRAAVAGARRPRAICSRASGRRSTKSRAPSRTRPCRPKSRA